LKPIDAAALNGHVEVVGELLNRGARIDDGGEFDLTLIYAAAENGHVDVVRELLNRGANMDIRYKYITTQINSDLR
jgi:ankyrin repeat protein